MKKNAKKHKWGKIRHKWREARVSRLMMSKKRWGGGWEKNVDDARRTKHQDERLVFGRQEREEGGRGEDRAEARRRGGVITEEMNAEWQWLEDENDGQSRRVGGVGGRWGRRFKERLKSSNQFIHSWNTYANGALSLTTLPVQLTQCVYKEKRRGDILLHSRIQK